MAAIPPSDETAGLLKINNLAYSDVSALRSALRSDRAVLEQNFLTHGNANRLLNEHTRLVDRYLRNIWRQLHMPLPIALVAVGGYARKKLYPKSDIDLMILLDTEADSSLQQKLQQLISMLWDIGLEVGHSTRTVAQCLAESSDLTVQTNLLEARRLCGNKKLFLELQDTLGKHLDPQKFFLAKHAEQQLRHARFLETDFNLEPNLKESPGGLRDLQTVSWIARAAGLGTHWSDLAKLGLMTTAEARQIGRNSELLATLRIRLHYLAKRHEDRILFDFQTKLAEQLGIHASANRLASEHLMQRYYRARLAVRQFNTILMQNLHDYLFHEKPVQIILNEKFWVVDTFLEIRDEQLFEHTPEAIFELFLQMEKRGKMTQFSAKTLRALWRAQRLVDASFRRNPVNRKNFMEILRQPEGVLHALRMMNQYGILGRYLPAFGRIVGQMQHDLFHVHTVDEHILMVVRNLRRLVAPEFTQEFPLCSKLMREFARPEVLYIAGLYHDVAKGQGGDHSQLGKKDARAFCIKHQLSNADTELIIWLVEHHLTLSSTAQKHDLSDPEVIADFADQIKDDRYLVALYLLTVADVRGTSPKVWNAWKARLMEDLFRLTRTYLSGGKISDQLGEIRRESADVLNLYALPPEAYQLLWAQLDNSYFLDHAPQEIAWHTRLLTFKVNAATPIVKARISRAGEGLQVMVYCPDQRSLFARICNFFTSMNFTIAEAKIHTTRHGYALDSFQIMEAVRSDTAYRDIMTYIEFELAGQIAQAKPITLSSSGRVNRQLKHFPISTQVEIKPDKKGLHILSLVAGDRPGLLARIALVLDRHTIRLHRAKISTLGSRAEDVFWISGAELDQPELTESLRLSLMKD